MIWLGVYFVTKLEDKSEWSGKTILKIGKFEPSSKICHVCKYHNCELTLKDREWKFLISRQNMTVTLMLQLISKNLLSLIKI